MAVHISTKADSLMLSTADVSSESLSTETLAPASLLSSASFFIASMTSEASEKFPRPRCLLRSTYSSAMASTSTIVPIIDSATTVLKVCASLLEGSANVLGGRGISETAIEGAALAVQKVAAGPHSGADTGSGNWIEQAEQSELLYCGSHLQIPRTHVPTPGPPHCRLGWRLCGVGQIIAAVDDMDPQASSAQFRKLDFRCRWVRRCTGCAAKTNWTNWFYYQELFACDCYLCCRRWAAPPALERPEELEALAPIARFGKW
jgi:hypothetical protein